MVGIGDQTRPRIARCRDRRSAAGRDKKVTVMMTGPSSLGPEFLDLVCYVRIGFGEIVGHVGVDREDQRDEDCRRATGRDRASYAETWARRRRRSGSGGANRRRPSRTGRRRSRRDGWRCMKPSPVPDRLSASASEHGLDPRYRAQSRRWRRSRRARAKSFSCSTSPWVSTHAHVHPRDWPGLRQIESVDLRHHDVEQHQVGALLQIGHSFLAICSRSVPRSGLRRGTSTRDSIGSSSTIRTFWVWLMAILLLGLNPSGLIGQKRPTP